MNKEDYLREINYFRINYQEKKYIAQHASTSPHPLSYFPFQVTIEKIIEFISLLLNLICQTKKEKEKKKRLTFDKDLCAVNMSMNGLSVECFNNLHPWFVYDQHRIFRNVPNK